MAFPIVERGGVMRSLVFILLLIISSSASAKTVKLNTGHCFIDTYRLVELDQFDYVYSLKKGCAKGKIIELNDGSLWQVEPQGAESSSFYSQLFRPLKFESVDEITRHWKRGELLIFHKITNTSSYLVYNIDRELVVDVTPYSPPTQAAYAIASIDYEQKTIALSDRSVWIFDLLFPSDNWEIGDPILIAKDTPWRGNNTHILVNLSPFLNQAGVEYIPTNRLGVQHAN